MDGLWGRMPLCLSSMISHRGKIGEAEFVAVGGGCFPASNTFSYQKPEQRGAIFAAELGASAVIGQKVASA